MRSRTRFVFLAAALVLAASALSTAAISATNDRWRVRLYAGSTVVGTWEALDPGRVEGDSLVFKIDAGIEERLVRISGTYSVEPIEK